MSKRTLVHRLGWVLIVVGVVALAWGFMTWRWGDPVTGIYTRWEQRRLTSEYERFAELHRLPPDAAASPRAKAREQRRAATRLRAGLSVGQPIGRLIVDRLGLDMVVVNGTDAATLRRGPGRDVRTFLPAEGQLVYIAGHRTTFGAPFAHIDRLHKGDRVVLEMPYGRFLYAVSRSVIVPSNDVDRLRSRGREEVALQACHPRFSARERFIVYALPVAQRSLNRSYPPFDGLLRR